jgi:hypothetical protein
MHQPERFVHGERHDEPRAGGAQIVIDSRYSPQTRRRAWLISPTVT